MKRLVDAVYCVVDGAVMVFASFVAATWEIYSSWRFEKKLKKRRK